MITVEQFNDRVKALFKSQQTMAGEKRWKNGKRQGQIRRYAAPLEFDAEDLRMWLARKVGLNAIPCPYCNAPIDILSLTLDHIRPRSAGGSFALDNMQCTCKDCNERKGNLSGAGFTALVGFMRSQLSPFDMEILWKRLKAANAGSANRFWRDKHAAARREHRDETVFELPEF